VIFSSGLGNVGADRVMDFIVDYIPAPSNTSGCRVNRWPLEMGTRRSAVKLTTTSIVVCVQTLSDAFSGRIPISKFSRAC